MWVMRPSIMPKQEDSEAEVLQHTTTNRPTAVPLRVAGHSEAKRHPANTRSTRRRKLAPRVATVNRQASSRNNPSLVSPKPHRYFSFKQINFRIQFILNQSQKFN